MDHLVVADHRDLVDVLLVGAEVRHADLELPPGNRPPLPSHLDVRRAVPSGDPAVARAIDHSHRQHVAPRAQRRGGQRITTRDVVAARAPHRGAVHPRHVVVVDRAEDERGTALRLGRGQLEGRAIPHRPVESLETVALPRAGDLDRPPRGVVERRAPPTARRRSPARCRSLGFRRAFARASPAAGRRSRARWP